MRNEHLIADANLSGENISGYHGSASRDSEDISHTEVCVARGWVSGQGVLSSVAVHAWPPTYTSRARIAIE